MIVRPGGAAAQREHVAAIERDRVVALTQMVIGGTTPFISLWLIEATGRTTAPALYLMFGATLSVAALAVLSRKCRLTDGNA